MQKCLESMKDSDDPLPRPSAQIVQHAAKSGSLTVTFKDRCNSALSHCVILSVDALSRFDPSECWLIFLSHVCRLCKDLLSARLCRTLPRTQGVASVATAVALALIGTLLTSSKGMSSCQRAPIIQQLTAWNTKR